MKKLILSILLVTIGCYIWGQENPNKKTDYKPWVEVNYLDHKNMTLHGKIVALEDTSLVLIKDPSKLTTPAYQVVPINSIEYLKVRGKVNWGARILLGAFLGGGSFYALSKGLDQSGRSEAAGQFTIKGALIGGALGIVVFPFRNLRKKLKIDGRQDRYEANKDRMGNWVLPKF
jgi:hypothetical protein